jgi:hypothetical protein
MKQGLLTAVAAVLALACASSANEPTRPQDPKTYTVFCKQIIKRALPSETPGKLDFDEMTIELPKLTTLEGTAAEFYSGHKDTSVGELGFRLQAEVKSLGENKARLDLLVEDTTVVFGAGAVPAVFRQKVVRQVNLNQTLKVDLFHSIRGEAEWVELTVQEVKGE